MDELKALLGQWRVVPVAVVDSADWADPVADALVQGGLACIEVTLRTPASLDALRMLAARGDIHVGAGSVTSGALVDAAVEAGARFIVSPGFSDGVLARCRALEVPVLPGVATPTEIMRALDAGVNVLKLFPAGQLGGIAAVRSLAAPFPAVRFVPTGGIGAADLTDYLGSPSVIAVGGSWMVAPDLARAGRFDEICRRTAEAVALAKDARP